MKVIKMFLIITLLISFIVGISSNVYGDEFVDDELTEDSVDYRGVKMIQSQSIKMVKDIISNSALKPSEGIFSRGLNNTKASTEEMFINDQDYFKMYYMNNSSFVGVIKSGNSFESNISNDYLWMAPVTNTTGEKYLISFAKDKTNTWNMIGFSEVDNFKLIDSFVNKKNILKSLKSEGIENPDKIKFIKADKYHLNLIYVKDGEDEYAMVYTANPGVYNLVNGKLYKISDLVEKLGDDTVESIKGEKLGGGLETKSSNKTPIYITIALISLLLLVKVNYKPRTK